MQLSRCFFFLQWLPDTGSCPATIRVNGYVLRVCCWGAAQVVTGVRTSRIDFWIYNLWSCALMFPWWHERGKVRKACADTRRMTDEAQVSGRRLRFKVSWLWRLAQPLSFRWDQFWWVYRLHCRKPFLQSFENKDHNNVTHCWSLHRPSQLRWRNIVHKITSVTPRSTTLSLLQPWSYLAQVER